MLKIPILIVTLLTFSVFWGCDRLPFSDSDSEQKQLDDVQGGTVQDVSTQEEQNILNQTNSSESSTGENQQEQVIEEKSDQEVEKKPKQEVLLIFK